MKTKTLVWGRDMVMVEEVCLIFGVKLTGSGH